MTCRAPTSSQTCAGSPSSYTGQQLTYDNEGHLTTWANSYTVPTESDTFLYDGEGNRIEQVVQTTVAKTDTVYVGGLEEVRWSQRRVGLAALLPSCRPFASVAG